MILTDQHLEAIKAAVLPIDYGSITIEAGADHLDIIVSHRIRIPKETAKTTPKPPPVIRQTKRNG